MSLRKIGRSGLVAFPLLLACFAVLVLVSVSGSVKDVLLQVKVTRAMHDRADLERWVRMGLNCAQTLAALPGGVCPAGEIDLYRFEPTTPIMVRKDAPYTQLGQFTVKAKCINGPTKTIELFVEKTGVANDLRKVKFTPALTC